MENNLLLSESQALRNQYQITVAEKDRQIAELQKLQQDAIVKKSVSAGSNYPVKVNKWHIAAGTNLLPPVYCIKFAGCFPNENYTVYDSEVWEADECITCMVVLPRVKSASYNYS